MTPRPRSALCILLAVSLVVTGCAQRYTVVQTQPSSPLASGGLEPGDHVRVELDDGRTIDGPLAYLGAGRYRVGATEIDDASVVSVSRREADVSGTMVAVAVVGFVALVAIVASVANDLDFGN